MRPAQSDSAHRCPQSHKRHSKPGRPGPARRPPRSRSKPGRRADERGEPLSRSPPQSRRHARTPASDPRERNRPPIWSCGCWQLRQRPWPLFCLCACCLTPPHAHGAGAFGLRSPDYVHNSSTRAWRGFRGRSAARRLAVRRRLAGRGASPPGPARRPQTGEVSFSSPAVDTETPQEAL